MLSAFIAIAQNKQVLYGMDEVPQSLLLNPGSIVSQKAHYGIPFLSQIHFNGGSSGVSAYDIFGKSDVDINTRIRNKIHELKNTDYFTATEQLEIINIGWRYKNDTYFSGGIYQEFDFITYFPRDLAILAWEGNRDYLDYEFDLGEISTTGDLLTVYHFGVNREISKKLTVGLRLKIYSSIASYRSVNNSGTFVTTLGDENSENIYDHTVRNADITVETSGYSSIRDADAVGGEILGRALFGGNIGVGADVGFTYKINNAFVLSGSVLDFGVIFHSKDVETYRVHGDYNLEGIELIFPPLSDGEATFPYYQDLQDEIERELPRDTLYNAYKQYRPAKINVGLTYNFEKFGGSRDCDCRNMDGNGSDRDGLGLQFYGIVRPKGLQMAGTLFYHRLITDNLSAKVTYTVDDYSSSNIGLGISANVGKLNMYVAADNLLWYANLAKAKSLSLQLGFNIIIDEE